LCSIQEEMAQRQDWIAERELFAPGCEEFDFEDDVALLPNTDCLARKIVVPVYAKNVRGAGPTLAGILGVQQLQLSQQPAPPLSPVKCAKSAPAMIKTPRGTKRPNDIEDIFI
jgi:hypothetical protein